MKHIKENNLKLLRDFSSIFSRNELNLMLKGNFSSLNLKIDRYSHNIPTSVFSSYLNFVKYAYKIIEHSYQNEYVLKNSFLTYWLIDELGKSNSVVLNEFRVGVLWQI